MSAFCPWFWINCYWIVNFVHSFSNHRKTYADAQETCEKAALNGFKTGRLFEPKTQSFNDKVYTEANIFLGRGQSRWIGIKVRGGSWGYTGSGTEIVFKNWHNSHKRRPNEHSHDCGYFVARGKGKWSSYRCNNNKRVSFICEFV